MTPTRARCGSAQGTVPPGTETYHVTLGGVDTVSQGLEGDPLDRHLGNAALPIVIPAVDLLGEPEVCHAHRHVIPQPGGKQGSGQPQGHILSHEAQVELCISKPREPLLKEAELCSKSTRFILWDEQRKTLTCSSELPSPCGGSSDCSGIPCPGQCPP